MQRRSPSHNPPAAVTESNMSQSFVHTPRQGNIAQGPDAIEIRAAIHRSVSGLVEAKHEISATLEDMRNSEATLSSERSEFQQVLNKYLLSYLDKISGHMATRKRQLTVLSQQAGDQIYQANSANRYNTHVHHLKQKFSNN